MNTPRRSPGRMPNTIGGVADISPLPFRRRGTGGSTSYGTARVRAGAVVRTEAAEDRCSYGPGPGRCPTREESMAAHPSATGQRLKVLVATDAARGSVRIMVHGCVTCVNLEGLDLVVRRASASTPDGRVVLDLGAAQAWWSVRADLDPRALAVRLTTSSSASTPLHLRVIAPRYIRS